MKAQTLQLLQGLRGLGGFSLPLTPHNHESCHRAGLSSLFASFSALPDTHRRWSQPLVRCDTLRDQCLDRLRKASQSGIRSYSKLFSVLCQTSFQLSAFASGVSDLAQFPRVSMLPFSSEITISTRRFCCLPASESLLATGYCSP